MRKRQKRKVFLLYGRSFTSLFSEDIWIFGKHSMLKTTPRTTIPRQHTILNICNIVMPCLISIDRYMRCLKMNILLSFLSGISFIYYLTCLSQQVLYRKLVTYIGDFECWFQLVAINLFFRPVGSTIFLCGFWQGWVVHSKSTAVRLRKETLGRYVCISQNSSVGSG